MKESLRDYMKVGIVHFMAYPFAASGEEPVADAVAEIVEDEFFDAIEVTRINDEAERRRVAGILSTAGVAVGFGGQPYVLKGGLNLNSSNEEERAHAIDVLKKGIDQAYELGAGKFGFLSGPRPPADERDRALELLVDSIVQPLSAPTAWPARSPTRCARPSRTSASWSTCPTCPCRARPRARR